jgi:hypothetical protein
MTDKTTVVGPEFANVARDALWLVLCLPLQVAPAEGARFAVIATGAEQLGHRFAEGPDKRRPTRSESLMRPIVTGGKISPIAMACGRGENAKMNPTMKPAISARERSGNERSTPTASSRFMRVANVAGGPHPQRTGQPQRRG